MSSQETTRWTVVVSKETDVVVRSLLAQRGLKKGDLSKFIEDAVNWRVFDQTLSEARTGFSDLKPDAREAMIAEACAAARKKTLRTLKKEK